MKLNPADIREGDILKMKKKHPCGSFEWEVIRTGADLRLSCLGCSRQIMMERSQIAKAVKDWRRP